MVPSLRRLLPILLLMGMGATGAEPTEIDRARQAAGINRFTAPSIDLLLQQLIALQPIPFEKVWRKPPDHPPQERVRLALLTGRLIADGFLLVATERPQRVESVGRSLLRMAKALGFGEKITRRGRNVIEQAEAERWPEARRELIQMQADVEAALITLRDEDLVNLIALGGWLRGLEITSAAVADNFTPERAQKLWQPELAGYFLGKLKAFRPETRNAPLARRIAQILEKVQGVVSTGKALSQEEVARLHELARAANEALLVEGEVGA